MISKLDLLFVLGRPLSPLYSLLMTTRIKLYQVNFFKRYSLPVPVISIGNLTAGGSGKTPVVGYLAQLLKNQGYLPAIISRGYGGTADKKSNIVSDGVEVFLSPEEAGDEPFMLAKTLKGIPVLTGKSRIHPCRDAIKFHRADVLLLDDGFQHISINRNIDLVLFNATTLAGNSRVFPGGVLREPVKALTRCDAFMLTGVDEDNGERANKFATLLKNKFPQKPLFFSHIYKYEIWSADEKRTITNPSLIGLVLPFCAIANPVRFQNSIKQAGINSLQPTSFRDHKKYSQRSMDDLCNHAVASHACALLTTEKDFVKINNFKRTLPLYVFKIKHQLDLTFEEYILEMLQ